MYPTILGFTKYIGLHSYGLMLAIGFFIGINLATRRAKRENVDPNKIIQLSFYMFVFSIIGARLLHVFAEDIHKYINNPIQVFYFWKGGFAFYGGFIFAILTALIYCYKNKLNFWKLGDIFSPSLAIGLSFGRMGCFLAGCCYGKECHLPWSITFPTTTLGKAGVPLHPTQTYSSLAALAIFIILMIYQNRKKFHGEVFFIFIILYSIARSSIEFFRDDHRGLFFNEMISTSQLISIPLIIFAIAGYIYFTKKTHDHNKTVM